MTEPAQRGRLWIAAIPVVAFAALALLFWRGLSGDPAAIPSALIGKPVINVWASWCVPCRLEHPLLMELGKRNDIRLVGLNYKDEPENARRFLGTMGQPFAAVGADQAGRAAVDWGVYGVPETFVIDGQGIIRYKWIGPLTEDGLNGTLAAEIKKASTPLP
jgi:cytochrome c biogenesis protein CcmG/thiol:disulfide interchange protein DsbE